MPLESYMLIDIYMIPQTVTSFPLQAVINGMVAGDYAHVSYTRHVFTKSTRIENLCVEE